MGGCLSKDDKQQRLEELGDGRGVRSGEAVPSRSGTSSGKAKAENGVYAPARSRSPSPQLKLNLPLRQDEPVANDHANGYANGHANGHANGIVPPTPSKRSAPKPEPAPSNVKVAIVVRPMLEFEYAARGRDIVSVVDDTTLRLPARCTVRSAEEYQFVFDAVYGQEDGAARSKLFSDLLLPMVARFASGFNATVLAYGQTGAGKTFTMGTNAATEEVVAEVPVGMIPSSINAVFDYMEAAAGTYDLNLKVSFVEIYNDQILDLLNPAGLAPAALLSPGANGNANGNNGSSNGYLSATVALRELPDGRVVLENAIEAAVVSRGQVAALLELGNSQRAVACHLLNVESSRSHAILTLSLEQRAKPSMAASVAPHLQYLHSKFHLVDLAGSERQKETGSTGQRFLEACAINKGLLELGNVIKALTEGAKRSHVPYRNSKLTRLLQDSLGGNSETLFIGCVSPCHFQHEHTIGTLRYATRAMAIQNTVRQNNSQSPEEELAYLRARVDALERENEDLRRKLAAATGGSASYRSGANGAISYRQGAAHAQRLSNGSTGSYRAVYN